MTVRCAGFLRLFGSLLVAILVFEVFFASDPGWAQRAKATRNSNQPSSPVVLKRGSAFPPLEGKLVGTDARFTIVGERRELRAFLFQPRGCAQQGLEIDCRTGSQTGTVQIPVFYFVTDNRRPIPREFRLRPPDDADIRGKKLELVEYPSAEVTYENEKSREFGRSGGRLQWVSVKSKENGGELRVALQICDGPAGNCGGSVRGFNLADLYTSSEPAAPGTTGMPPTKPIAGTKAGALPEPTLPGVKNEPFPQLPLSPQPPARTDVPRPDRTAAPAGPKLRSTLAVDGNSTIDLSVRGVPPEYNANVVERLIVSALSTRVSISGALAKVLEVKVAPGSSDLRKGTVVVKRELSSKLSIAGRAVECDGNKCHADLSLKEWIIYLNAIPAKEASRALAIPVLQLSGPPEPDQFYSHLGISDQHLPTLRKPGVSLAHIRVYLLDNSKFQVQFRNFDDQSAPSIIIPSDSETAALSLVNASDSRWILAPNPAAELGDRVAQGSPPEAAPTVGAAQPPARARAHLIFQAHVEQPGWSPDSANRRLLQLLQGNGAAPARVVLKTSGGQIVASDGQKIESLEDGLMVWSGEVPQSDYTWQVDGLPAGITYQPATLFVPVRNGDRRFRPNDLVSYAVVSIPALLLYDRWYMEVSAVNRIYGRDKPIEANELCEFHLIAQSSGASNDNFDVALKLASQGGTRVLRTTEPIETGRLPIGEKSWQLDVRGHGGGARCAPGQTKLPPLSQWSVSEESNTGVMSVGATVSPRGRWFLGLYAPQDMGAVEGDSRSIADAQQEIFKRFTIWLEDWRARYFSSAEPARAALGFDLALLSGADGAVENLPIVEASILTGKFRRAPTQTFQLDNEAGQRVNEFMSGPKSAGGAPSFPTLGQSIRRYSHLFGAIADDRAPMVVYVGANKPLPTSCPEWVRVTQEIAMLPGKPRVLAVAFTNSSASDIGRDLGMDAQVRVVTFNTLSRGYACDGANRSTLVFVPFSDLVAQKPGDVLGGVFRVLDLWFAELERG